MKYTDEDINSGACDDNLNLQYNDFETYSQWVDYVKRSESERERVVELFVAYLKKHYSPSKNMSSLSEAKDKGLSNKVATKGRRWGAQRSAQSGVRGGGVKHVITDRGGGFLLSPARVDTIPETFRNSSGAYSDTEELEQFVIPTFFPENCTTGFLVDPEQGNKTLKKESEVRDFGVRGLVNVRGNEVREIVDGEKDEQ